MARINERRHTRFGVSRRERFESIEKAALKPLPIGDLEYGDWKDVHTASDCYVYVEGDYYSAPHIHRHKKLRIKITENQVEIFLNLERLAIHPRSRHRNGKRIFIDAHFPPASQAYTKPVRRSCSLSPIYPPGSQSAVRRSVQRRHLWASASLSGFCTQLHQGD